MTGRELLLNTVHGGERDRLTWTTLIDAKARSFMPEGLRETSTLELYRMMGCDIMQFGNMGLDADERKRTQDAFSDESLNVVAATVAFGMGIDRR